DVRGDGPFDNAFKVQWERFLLHVATGAPFPHDFVEGAKGVQLAELALESWRERRWVDVPDLTRRGAAESSPPVPLSVPERGNSGTAFSSPSPEELALSAAKGRGGQGVRTKASQGARIIRLPLSDGSIAPYT